MGEAASYFQDRHIGGVDFDIISLSGERIDLYGSWDINTIDQEKWFHWDLSKTAFQVIDFAFRNCIL